MRNKYVKSASYKSITYTEEFREYFILEYEAGKLPVEILQSCGFDVVALGRCRINAISKRFRKMSKREEGFRDTRKNSSGRPRTKELTPEEQIARLKHQIEYLKQENEYLKKINFVNRQAQWKFKQSQKKSSK